MAGRGPTPKPPERRARRNKDPIATRVFPFDPVDPYPLPDDLLPADEVWHPATLRWWRRWCESPLAADLPAVDWSELEACAVLHHEYMRARTFTLASELRLRMAAFGATPADRARLRYQVAVADEKDAARTQPSMSARDRYRGLEVVGTGSLSGGAGPGSVVDPA